MVKLYTNLIIILINHIIYCKGVSSGKSTATGADWLPDWWSIPRPSRVIASFLPDIPSLPSSIPYPAIMGGGGGMGHYYPAAADATLSNSFSSPASGSEHLKDAVTHKLSSWWTLLTDSALTTSSRASQAASSASASAMTTNTSTSVTPLIGGGNGSKDQQTVKPSSPPAAATTVDPIVPTIDSSRLATSCVAKILTDARLVPRVIYEMECLPGLAFHQCIQNCNSSATQASKGGTYEESEKFKSCVQNCNDALLKSTGPGCITEDGTLIERDPKGSHGLTYSPGAIAARAWWYRLKSWTRMPAMKVAGGFISKITVLLLLCSFTFACVHYKLYEFIFILTNGLPEESVNRNGYKGSEIWANWEEQHLSVTRLLNDLEEVWDKVAAWIVGVLHKGVELVQYLIASTNRGVDYDYEEDAVGQSFLTEAAANIRRNEEHQLEVHRRLRDPHTVSLCHA